MRRSLITSGELRRLIDEDGLSGVTSNPAIFEKAVTGSGDYRDVIESPAARTMEAKTLYETLAVRDVQDAADVLRPVYDRTGRRDGYVSLEVSPLLAHDTPRTLDEARRLWSAVGRDNLMIKIPATPEGIAAIRELVSEGLNVNATLLFAPEMYEQVADAYMSGLEAFVARGRDPRHVAAVASFFVSRIDTAVDDVIASRREGMTAREHALLRGLTGKVAIANAKLVYQRYREIIADSRWQALAARGAQTQRLLWASTGTKNPLHRDVLYVEELTGPDTVTTIPPATLDAFRDHGRPRASLGEDLESACDIMDLLAQCGIPMKQVTDRLLAEGVRLFTDAFTQLLTAIDQRRQAARATGINRLTYHLSESMMAAVKDTLAEWRAQNKVRQLWARDASLWTGTDEGRWLGWLGITNGQLAHIERLTHIRDVTRATGFSHVLLLGMGGSSLGPEVITATFGRTRGYPELHVLDSTDPAQVMALEQKVDLKNTFFIVSSKSGSTLEPNIFKQYFFERVKQLVGAEEAGRRFAAITDPGSKMQHVAEADRFRRVFFGWPDIGGRYSVLSDFGLVPAAIIGIDVPKFLSRTEEMVYACMPPVPVEENPGVVLGAVLGVAASRFGRDKVTIVSSPGVSGLGAWLEQLIAESTGKEGKGVLPIDREPVGSSDAYGQDRIFVYVRLTDEYERTGTLPVETPIFVGDGIELFADGKNAAALAAAVDGDRTLPGYLKAHLSRLEAGDYFALLAYLGMNEQHDQALQAMRQEIRSARRVATSVEFGPRFLHSTGQFYKGGPNTGVFLQITCDDADLPVPGQRYTFGVVKAAQARGDFQVLVERGRRALRAHLGNDVGAGLATLQKAITEVLLVRRV